MKANRHGRSFSADETGAFPVVEAILVAVIVLSAIIFFTSVQRPTTGSEVGGLDLGQFAADTLQVLESHDFNDLEYPDWVTSLATGVNPTTGAVDTATPTEVDDFIGEVLPSGAEYSLRITNGVTSHPVLPSGDLPTPHGANAAEVAFVPPWGTFAGQTSTITVATGEIILASDATRYPLVNPASIGTYRCLQDPRGAGHFRDGPDSATNRDSWWGHWHSTPNATTGSPEVNGVPAWKGADGQVPGDIPLGTWRLSSGSACSETGATYVKVVSPDCLAAPTSSKCSSPYAAYGLQLVVWFGA